MLSPVQFEFREKAASHAREALLNATESSGGYSSEELEEIRKAVADSWEAKDNRLNCELWGADMVELDVVSYTIEPSVTFGAFIGLYQDGSPFVPGEDFNKGIDSNLYIVAATPDFPPLMLSNRRGSPSWLEQNPDYTLNMLISDTETNSIDIHVLSPEECIAFLGAISNCSDLVNLDRYDFI